MGTRKHAGRGARAGARPPKDGTRSRARRKPAARSESELIDDDMFPGADDLPPIEDMGVFRDGRSREARRRLERYWEERRLMRDLQDEYDL